MLKIKFRILFLVNRLSLLFAPCFQATLLLVCCRHVAVEISVKEFWRNWNIHLLSINFFDELKGTEHLKGEYKLREVKTRVNQNVFRQIVVANYNGRCAITGIDIPDLLLASHIIPWSKNEKERLNPENGICLSALYDKAYDKGYIGINENFEIILSPLLKKKHEQDYYQKYFSPLQNAKIMMPQKYYPKKQFLQFHLEEVFKG